MSRLNVDDIKNRLGEGQPDIIGVAKAFVNFNGEGVVAIRGGFNVSSITDNGTGDYTINFITAMPDANYVLSGTAMRGGLGAADWFLAPKQSATYGDAFSTTFARVMARVDNGQPSDSLAVSATIFSN